MHVLRLAPLLAESDIDSFFTASGKNHELDLGAPAKSVGSLERWCQSGHNDTIAAPSPRI